MDKHETEPVLAWRAWRTYDPGILLSVANEYAWVPLRPARSLGLPDPHNNFGLWAYKDKLEMLENYIYNLTKPRPPTGLGGSTWVYGQVWLWGRVVEHERGYRSQFAYPAHLFADWATDQATIKDIAENDPRYLIPGREKLEEICETYRVPVSVNDKDMDLVKEKLKNRNSIYDQINAAIRAMPMVPFGTAIGGGGGAGTVPGTIPVQFNPPPWYVGAPAVPMNFNFVPWYPSTPNPPSEWPRAEGLIKTPPFGKAYEKFDKVELALKELNVSVSKEEILDKEAERFIEEVAQRSAQNLDKTSTELFNNGVKK